MVLKCSLCADICESALIALLLVFWICQPHRLRHYNRRCPRLLSRHFGYYFTDMYCNFLFPCCYDGDFGGVVCDWACDIGGGSGGGGGSSDGDSGTRATAIQTPLQRGITYYQIINQRRLVNRFPVWLIPRVSLSNYFFLGLFAAYYNY